jgi:indolepyruvate ferredoxin oxidoreductase beta subunit
MREFNTVVIGVGGQGVITTMQIIAQAALEQGYDVKTSEVHGLAQRGGSVPCHIRFGNKIYSPLVMQGEAHLIIALEPVEALRACYYGSKENKTVFLVNTYKMIPLSVPIIKEYYPRMDEITQTIKNFASKVVAFNASKIVKMMIGNIVLTNIFLLGYANSKGFIPLEKESFLNGIKETIPEKYVDLNNKVFELGYKAGSS